MAPTNAEARMFTIEFVVSRDDGNIVDKVVCTALALKSAIADASAALATTELDAAGFVIRNRAGAAVFGKFRDDP